MSTRETIHPTSHETMRILGVDSGLRITGFGVIDGIAQIVATHNPHQAAIEKVFVNVTPQSTLLHGQARGAAIAALVNCNLP